MAVEELDLSTFAPTVRFNEVGQTFKGVKVGTRELKGKYGVQKVYQLKVIDGSAVFSRGKVDVDVSEGEIVEIFGSKLIDRALSQLENGETIELTYKGVEGRTKIFSARKIK